MHVLSDLVSLHLIPVIIEWASRKFWLQLLLSLSHYEECFVLCLNQSIKITCFSFSSGPRISIIINSQPAELISNQKFRLAFIRAWFTSAINNDCWLLFRVEKIPKEEIFTSCWTLRIQSVWWASFPGLWTGHSSFPTQAWRCLTRVKWTV